MTAKRILQARIGVVANPHAGHGEQTIVDVVRRLFTRLADERFVLIDGTFEAKIAAELGIRADLVTGWMPELDSRGAASLLLQAGAAGLVGVGGDGTLRDIASALCADGNSAWLLGVGVGSANVGPLVSVRGSSLNALLLDRLTEVTVHGVEAFSSGGSLGVAFNDVAFANSFFGTREGRRVDLDAAEALAGNDRAAVPVSVCGADTWIAKNGRKMVDGRNDAVAQIIASPVNYPGDYAGMAVSGLMCWGPYVGQHAVLTAASTVMIRSRLTSDDIVAVEPLRLTQISFGETDLIEVGGLKNGAVLVLDGTPTRRLHPTDVTALRVRIDAVRTLRVAPCRQDRETVI